MKPVIAWVTNERTKAGVGGVLALFFDHPIATSLVFLVMAITRESSDTLMAIGGVMLSFVLFAPLAFGVGLLGGSVAKIWRKTRAADT